MKRILASFCRLFRRHLKERTKPYRRLRATKLEEKYIMETLTQRAVDVHIAVGSLEKTVDELGGINTILNGYSDDTITFYFSTSLVVGDFQQILREYRRLSNLPNLTGK